MNRPVEWFPGEWNFCCDRCGFEYKSSQARHEWTGLIVCPYCRDPRHPQDFVRGRVDRIAVPWVRICCDDTFLDDALRVALWSPARGGDNSAGIGSTSEVSQPTLTALATSDAKTEAQTRCAGATSVFSLAFTDSDQEGSLYILDAGTPANDTDVAHDLDALTAEFTQAGEAKYIVSPDGSGYMKWSAHNLFLNSDSPADQSITVVSGQLYAVINTGSVTTTLSNAASLSINSAATWTFTAGTTTLTFSGTTGTGTVTVCKWPADTRYLPTTDSARYAWPIERDGSGNIRGALWEFEATQLLSGSNIFTSTHYTIESGLELFQDQTGPNNIANYAWRMQAKAGTAPHRFYQFSGAGFRNLSIIAKAGTASIIRLYQRLDSANTFGTYFDLANGTILTDNSAYSAIRDLGNGWYECQAYNTLASFNYFVCYIHSADAQNDAWAADGDEYVLICDAQLEGDTDPHAASSRIPSFSTAGVTRATDNWSLATSNFYLDGTVNAAMVQWQPRADRPEADVLYLSDGTANNIIAMGPNDGSTPTTALNEFDVVVSSVSAVNITPAGAWTLPNATRMAAKWKANDFIAATAGGAETSDASGSLPTVTTLTVGRPKSPGVQSGGGHIQKLLICPGDHDAREVILLSNTDETAGDLANALLAQWDPSDLSTLWQDTAGTVPVTADGQFVARMDDKSGNGYHLLQASASLRPLYKTAGGLHWIQFDGTNDYLSIASPAFPLDKLEVFFAASETVAGVNDRIMSFAPSSGNDYQSASGLVIDASNGVDSHLFVEGQSASLSVVASGSPPTPLAVYELNKTATTVYVRVNGTLAASDTSFTAFNATHSGNFYMGIGVLSGAVSNTLAFNGRIYGAYITGLLTDAARATVRSTLTTKAGL